VRNTLRNGSILTLSLLIAGILAPGSAQAGIWPFASKKHIKKQIDPLTGRVSELEEVNRQQASRIKEMDERNQAGINAAMSKTMEADGKATTAAQKAAEAETAAGKAFASVGETESRLNGRIENAENYSEVRTVQVNFKLNHSQIDEVSRETLDQLAGELKDSKGYVLEVQGFADPSGSTQANAAISRERANSVVRYLSEKHNVPLFRMRMIGMGSASAVQDENGKTSRAKSRRVEVHLLRTANTEVASK